MRLSTDGGDCEAGLASIDVRGIGHRPVVVLAPSVDLVAISTESAGTPFIVY